MAVSIISYSISVTGRYAFQSARSTLSWFSVVNASHIYENERGEGQYEFRSVTYCPYGFGRRRKWRHKVTSPLSKFKKES